MCTKKGEPTGILIPNLPKALPVIGKVERPNTTSLNGQIFDIQGINEKAIISYLLCNAKRFDVHCECSKRKNRQTSVEYLQWNFDN